jgi:hypothetical protein
MENRRRSAFWILAALVPAALLLIAIARLAVNIPYWDDWRWADMVIKFDTHQLTFADLWHPEVEHRLLVPSLVALGLSRFGGYSTVVESYFSWACSLVSLGCLYVLVKETMSESARGPVLFVQSALLFSLAQLTTYLWGFQIAWIMINTLALVVLALLAPARTGTLRFTLALAAGIAAALSSAQGLLVLPLGFFVLAVRRPRPNRFLLLWALASVVVILVYVPGLHAHLRDEGLTLGGQAVRVLVGPIVLGAPVAGWSGVLGAFVAGMIVLLFTAAATVVCVRLLAEESNEASRWVPWLGLTLFGVIGSLVIAFARGALGLSYGLQERYITMAAMAWIGLVPLYALRLETLRARTPQRVLAWVLLGGILALSLARESVSTIPQNVAARERRLAQLELIHRYRSVTDAELIVKIFPNDSARAFMRLNAFPSPDEIRRLLAGLEANHEGPFRE